MFYSIVVIIVILKKSYTKYKIKHIKRIKVNEIRQHPDSWQIAADT